MISVIALTVVAGVVVLRSGTGGGEVDEQRTEVVRLQVGCGTPPVGGTVDQPPLRPCHHRALDDASEACTKPKVRTVEVELLAGPKSLVVESYDCEALLPFLLGE